MKTCQVVVLTVLACVVGMVNSSERAYAELERINLDGFTNPNGVSATVSTFGTVNVNRTAVANNSNSGSYGAIGGGLYQYNYLGTEFSAPMTITYSLSSGTFFDLVQAENPLADAVVDIGIYADGTLATYELQTFTILNGVETDRGTQQILSGTPMQAYGIMTDGNFDAVRFEFSGLAPVLNGSGLQVGGLANGFNIGFSAVPEPSSMLLVMSVLGGMAIRRRR